MRSTRPISTFFALTSFCAALIGFAWIASAQDGEPKEADEAPVAVDLQKVLAGSKEFAAECKRLKIEWEEGRVTALGEIVHRGGGPCEYLVGIFPSKAHETIVLMDDGPFKGEGRRPREYVAGLATNINNALVAAGWKKGRPFGWNRETGEIFEPEGEATWIYCEWDEDGKSKRALMSDWLWSHKRIQPMNPGLYVYTGSEIYDEGPPSHKKWLGAEMEGLLVAVLSTSSALFDHRDPGGGENGVYEAIAIRIPPIGTRVKVVFSKKPLDGAEKFKPLKLPKQLQEARKKLLEQEALEKAATEKGGATDEESGAAEDEETGKDPEKETEE